ncbi:MAG: hypothetical protein AB7I29_14575 [Geobacter sp.]
MNCWLAFFSGAFLGCIIGMGALSLAVVAGQADRDLERIQPPRRTNHAGLP